MYRTAPYIQNIKDQLKTIANVDDAFCIGVMLWTNAYEDSKNEAMLKILKVNPEDYIKQVNDKYRLLVKNSNIADKYKNILYRIFEVQDYIKTYVNETAFISKELKSFLNEKVLNSPLYK